MFLVLGGMCVNALTNVSTCSVLNANGEVYEMNQTVTASSGTCLNINASNIVLDCKGFVLNGTASIGILTDSSNNITVKNCSVYGSISYAYDFYNTSNSSLLDSNANVSGVGLLVTTISNAYNNFSNIQINTSGSNQGVYLYRTTNNFLNNVRAYAAGYFAFFSATSGGSSVNYNTISNSHFNGTYGAYIQESFQHNVISNTVFFGRTNDGVRLLSGSSVVNNTFDNVSFFALGGAYPLYSGSNVNTTINNSYFQQGTNGYAIYAPGSGFKLLNSVVNHTVSGSMTLPAVYFDTGLNNVVENSRVLGGNSASTGSKGIQVRSQGATSIRISGVNVSGFGYGLSLEDSLLAWNITTSNINGSIYGLTPSTFGYLDSESRFNGMRLYYYRDVSNLVVEDLFLNAVGSVPASSIGAITVYNATNFTVDNITIIGPYSEYSVYYYNVNNSIVSNLTGSNLLSGYISAYAYYNNISHVNLNGSHYGLLFSTDSKYNRVLDYNFTATATSTGYVSCYFSRSDYNNLDGTRFLGNNTYGLFMDGTSTENSNYNIFTNSHFNASKWGAYLQYTVSHNQFFNSSFTAGQEDVGAAFVFYSSSQNINNSFDTVNFTANAPTWYGIQNGGINTTINNSYILTYSGSGYPVHAVDTGYFKLLNSVVNYSFSGGSAVSAVYFDNQRDDVVQVENTRVIGNSGSNSKGIQVRSQSYRTRINLNGVNVSGFTYGVSIEDTMTVANFTGGNINGSTYGAYVTGNIINVTVDDTARFNGLRWYLIKSNNSFILRDLVLNASNAPTNYGTITILNATNVTISNTTGFGKHGYLTYFAGVNSSIISNITASLTGGSIVGITSASGTSNSFYNNVSNINASSAASGYGIVLSGNNNLVEDANFTVNADGYAAFHLGGNYNLIRRTIGINPDTINQVNYGIYVSGHYNNVFNSTFNGTYGAHFPNSGGSHNFFKDSRFVGGMTGKNGGSQAVYSRAVSNNTFDFCNFTLDYGNIVFNDAGGTNHTINNSRFVASPGVAAGAVVIYPSSSTGLRVINANVETMGTDVYGAYVANSNGFSLISSKLNSTRTVYPAILLSGSTNSIVNKTKIYGFSTWYATGSSGATFNDNLFSKQASPSTVNTLTPLNNVNSTSFYLDWNSIDNITSVRNFLVANDFAFASKIVYLNAVNVSLWQATNYNLGNGFVSVNSSNLHSSLNSTANVSLKNVNCSNFALYYSGGFYSTAAEVIINGVLVATPANVGGNCTNSGLCQKLACSSSSLDFEAQRFSSFAFLETTNASPYFYNLTNFPASPLVFNSSRVYVFNSSWNSSAGISTILFELNNSLTVANYTATSLGGNVYSVNFTGLFVGNYSYRWFGSNPVGQSNSTQVFTYNITKSNASVLLYLNGSAVNLTANYGNLTNATAFCSEGNVTLYREGVQLSNGSLAMELAILGAGNYNYTAACFDANHFGNTTTLFLNITKASGNVTLFLNGSRANLTIAFNLTLNVSAFVSPSLLNVSLFRDGALVSNPFNSTLGVGNYVFLANTSGNANYSPSLESWNLTVIPANVSSFLLLNGSAANLTANYGNLTNATAYCSAGNATLFRNGSLVGSALIASELAVFGANYYNYTSVCGGGNYSTNVTTLFLAVLPVLAPLNLTLNGVEGSLAVNAGTSVTINATSAFGNVSLFVNGANVSIPYSTSSLAVGAYSVFANVSSTSSNYSNSERNYTLTITSANVSATSSSSGGSSSIPTPPTCVRDGACNAACSAGADVDCSVKVNESTPVSSASGQAGGAEEKTGPVEPAVEKPSDVPASSTASDGRRDSAPSGVAGIGEKLIVSVVERGDDFIVFQVNNEHGRPAQFANLTIRVDGKVFILNTNAGGKAIFKSSFTIHSGVIEAVPPAVFASGMSELTLDEIASPACVVGLIFLTIDCWMVYSLLILALILILIALFFVWRLKKVKKEVSILKVNK